MSENSNHAIQRIYFIIIIVLLLVLIGQRLYPTHGRIQIPSGKWDKLYLILNQIEKNYVDPINAGTIVEKSLPYILEELDPHSVYLPPAEMQSADAALEGNFDGIGITFNVPNDTAIVASVIQGGPSERAGIQQGDRIVKVNKRTIAGVKMKQDSIVKLLRGPRGTKVTIEIKRYGLSDLLPVPLVRDKIPEKSVDAFYMIDGQTGYIKLSRFSKTSYEEVLTALSELTGQGMVKLIFDLRKNSGGYMTPALKIANQFLDKDQLIFYTEGAHRARQNFYAETQGLASRIELAVLIDESTASSSEILAGALQDNDRGLIIGRRSYGKGLVQEPVYFSDGSGMRLTVSRYFTPTGRSLQRPYDNGRESYRYDIWERYQHGELTEADSIPKNDSLKFSTPKGKVVYGGGGIIPDLFVPLDTTKVNDFFEQAYRKNLMIRFGIQFADNHRSELREVKRMDELDSFFSRFHLEKDFLAFAATQGLTPKPGEWEGSKKYIMTQVHAYIGRNTPMDEQAFYSIMGKLDRELQVAVGEMGKIVR